MVAEAPDAEVEPLRMANKTDCGIVSFPPSIPDDVVIVYGIGAVLVKLRVALNVPEAAIPPVNVAVPEAV
jgi:hypothetical protein